LRLTAQYRHERVDVVEVDAAIAVQVDYEGPRNPVTHVWGYLRENHFGKDTFLVLEAVRERRSERLRARAAGSGPLPDLLRLAQYRTLVVKSA
jgi:hypothetical protein